MHADSHFLLYISIRLLCFKTSLGFPCNPAVESLNERRAEQADDKREKAEATLKRMLDHRRRLLEVLKASQVGIHTAHAGGLDVLPPEKCRWSLRYVPVHCSDRIRRGNCV